MKNTGFSIKAGALCLLSIAGAAALPTNVLAENITLRSSDGTVNLTGEFLEFKDNAYVVRTPLGDLRIASSRVSCDGAACPVFEVAEADVEIAGSETIGLGLMPLLVEGYAGYLDAAATMNNTDKEAQVLAELVGDGGFGDDLGSYLVSSSSSTDAFSMLLAGDTDIGMSSRRIRPNEARALRDSGAGNMVSPDQEHIIGVDSLVVVTHPDNPVDAISLDQLGKIYAGAITNWSEVGGPDADILVVDRPEGSGTREVLADVFQASSDSTLEPLEVQIADDNSIAATIVRENENAIGFVGYAFQRGTKALPLIDECGQSMTPDAFSARTEEYGLQRRLYLYNRADLETEQVREFLTYAASPAADGVISKSGFIGLGVDRRPLAEDTDRINLLQDDTADSYEAVFMQAMYTEMLDYDRLSTTLRFRTGSSRLDERGQADLRYLVDYLEAQPDGTEVVVAGFTDSVGAFDANRELSEKRAAQVLDILANVAGDRLGNIQFETRGYGEIAPSGCNVSDEGRRINRRVEVWVKSAT